MRSVHDIERDVERWQGRQEGLAEARLAWLRWFHTSGLSGEAIHAFATVLIHHETETNKMLCDRKLELARAHELEYRKELA